MHHIPSPYWSKFLKLGNLSTNTCFKLLQHYKLSEFIKLQVEFLRGIFQGDRDGSQSPSISLK